MKYTKLEAVQVLKDGEDYIHSEEWLKRAKEITKGTMNDEVFEFYAQKENWHLLPEDCDWLFFPDTEFRHSVGDRCVRYLYRYGAEWYRDYILLRDRFVRRCRVARLASASPSETQTSLDPLTSDLPSEKHKEYHQDFCEKCRTEQECKKEHC